jgi:osmotically-inducible protein OsmY
MKSTSLIVAAAAAFLTTGGAAFAAAGSAQDSDITAQVSSKLAREGGDLDRVQVTTQDGVVTLSGSVDSGHAEQKAMSDARLTPGVVNVRNEMHITM